MGDWQHAFIKILLAEAGTGRLELILIRERSLATPRSRTDITTFGEGEKFRIASKSSSEFDVGRGSSPGHVLHPFLLRMYVYIYNLLWPCTI